MKTRITADLDTLNIEEIIKNVSMAIKIIPSIEKLELKKSNSKGYHLIVWSKNKALNDDDIKYMIRELIGDDKTRIRLDKSRTIGKDTLFYKKEKYKNKRT